MASNPLGAGTCNLCVNVRRSVHSAVGRLAFLHYVSMGALVRWAIARAAGLSRAATAAERDDLAAIKLLREAGSDGYSNADLPAIEAAIRLIARSAARDRDLATIKP
jgi:hypothetical protein